MLFISLLTITLEGHVFDPCSQMRKLKLSGDGNLPMRRRGSMILYEEGRYCLVQILILSLMPVVS